MASVTSRPLKELRPGSFVSIARFGTEDGGERTLELNGLLEGDTLRTETLNVDLSASLNNHLHRLRAKKSLVVVDEWLLVLLVADVDGLGDVDDGQSGLGLWHLELGKWSLSLDHHVGLEGVDGRVDGVGGLNPGVDGDGDLVRPWVGDADGVDMEDGIVNLVLDHLWNSNEEAGFGIRICSESMAKGHILT